MRYRAEVPTLKASYFKERERCKMFLENLSTSVLRLCALHELSYEKAAEKCKLSSRYFGDIARRRTAPTVATLEKICNGFGLEPNDLLINMDFEEKIARLEPLTVEKIYCFHCLNGPTSYPVCPNCDISLEREYQNFCDRCGQCLDWSELEHATIIFK